ncbi:GNAT family N-acetyltransferase [Paenibacillus chibensis]|uniref:GNAT family N-acetyltransferase n=1 Tax=Paenibacillus chibensis TaxID=59846 RepID=UPI003D2CE742
MIRKSDKKVFKHSVLCFIGRGDYFNFIVDSEKHSPRTVIKELFSSIEEHAGKWDKIELSHLSKDSTLLYYLLRHNRYNSSISYLTTCPQINLKSLKTSRQEERQPLNTKARYKLNKLRKDIGYEFKLTSGSENEAIYNRISQVHKNEKMYLLQEKGRLERKSIFEGQNNEDFYKCMFHENEHVIVAYLESDQGSIIAYQVHYLMNGVLYGWNTGYDPAYAQYGVFDVLMLELIRTLHDQEQITTIDMGAGSYPWKYKWTDQFVVTYSFTLWNRNSHWARLVELLVQTRRGIRAAKGVDKVL